MAKRLLFKTKQGVELWEHQEEDILNITLSSTDPEAIKEALKIDASSPIEEDRLAAEEVLWAIELFGIKKEN